MKRSQLARPLRGHPPYLSMAKAFARAWISFRKLPPGNFVHIDELERGNRTVLIDREATYGPVFKAFMEKRMAVCVVGHALGRRLLKEHASALKPVTIQLEPLVPKGFMRQMEGQCHRDYRRKLVRALQSLDLAPLLPEFETILSQNLEAFARNAENDPGTHSWSDALSRIATGMLICLFFGACPGSPFFERLMAAYYRLGPHGVVWRITGKQIKAFNELRSELQDGASLDHTPPAIGLLNQTRDSGPVDDTLLGNLIYMVELGRYDLRGLFRWISKYAAEQPAWIDRIASESFRGPTGEDSVAEAFVLEVLRLEQSERLMRNVLKDIDFEGFFIPKGTLVRICMWEAHKAESVFEQPFRFDPARFLNGNSPGERFSPFGLDHHHCPFASVSVRLAMLFVRLLARKYRINAQGGDPAVRGPYHWEPAPDLSIHLEPR